MGEGGGRGTVDWAGLFICCGLAMGPCWGLHVPFSNTGGCAFVLVIVHIDLWQVEVWHLPVRAVIKHQVTLGGVPYGQLQQQTCVHYRYHVHSTGTTSTHYTAQAQHLHITQIPRTQHRHNIYTLHRYHVHSTGTTSTHYTDTTYTAKAQHLHITQTACIQQRHNIYTLHRQHVHSTEKTCTQ